MAILVKIRLVGFAVLKQCSADTRTNSLDLATHDQTMKAISQKKKSKAQPVVAVCSASG